MLVALAHLRAANAPRLGVEGRFGIGHGQQGFVVHIGGAGADKGNGQGGIQGTQGLHHAPPRMSTANDHHRGWRFARAPARCGRCCGAMRGRGLTLLCGWACLNQLKVGFCDRTQRARPVVWDVFKPCACGQTTVGVALGLVVHPATGTTKVASKRRCGGGAGVHDEAALVFKRVAPRHTRPKSLCAGV